MKHSPAPETVTAPPLHPADLTLLRCADCGRLDSRQRVLCSGCLSARLTEERVEGHGHLVTLTTIRRAPSAWRDRAPYRVVVVDLDAGLRVTGRLAPEAPEPELGDRLSLREVDGQDLIFIPFENEPHP
jgi:uncharacterized OB-fold protein